MKTIDGQLFVENIPVIELAKEYGSPLFIYSSKEIENNFLNYKNDLGGSGVSFFDDVLWGIHVP